MYSAAAVEVDTMLVENPLATRAHCQNSSLNNCCLLAVTDRIGPLDFFILLFLKRKVVI